MDAGDRCGLPVQVVIGQSSPHLVSSLADAGRGPANGWVKRELVIEARRSGRMIAQMRSGKFAPGGKIYRMANTCSDCSQDHVDHRTLVAAERRERTRAKLLMGALRVFSKYGVDAKVIELVIQEAGVARGTFYNYFSTNEELFVEVAQKVSNEIINIVEPLVLKQKDPAARVACGLTSVIKLAITYPVLAQFVVRGGPPALSAGSLASEVVPRDIRAGIASGRFSVTDEQLAFALILGPVIMAFHTVLSGRVSADYPALLAQAVLQSLGVSKSLAGKYAFQDFGEVAIAEDSFFALASG